MDDTMTRLLAGDALTPMEAAVFGAEFARGRWRGDPPVTARRVAFGESCLAVDSLNAALAEAGASAPVAPVAEPVAVTFEPGPIRPEPPDHEVDRLRGVLSSLIDWTNQHGRNLCPGTVDTYGEGVRACKSEVANMISAAFLAEPAPAEEPMPHLALLGPSPSPLIRKSAEKGVWRGVNWLVEAGRDGDGVRLMIWCPYRPEGEPIAAVHDVTAWRTGDAQRVATDLLHAALRRALAARPDDTDNTGAESG